MHIVSEKDWCERPGVTIHVNWHGEALMTGAPPAGKQFRNEWGGDRVRSIVLNFVDSMACNLFLHTHTHTHTPSPTDWPGSRSLQGVLFQQGRERDNQLSGKHPLYPLQRNRGPLGRHGHSSPTHRSVWPHRLHVQAPTLHTHTRCQHHSRRHRLPELKHVT